MMSAVELFKHFNFLSYAAAAGAGTAAPPSVRGENSLRVGGFGSFVTPNYVQLQLTSISNFQSVLRSCHPLFLGLYCRI
jgi:hypothetical protein